MTFYKISVLAFAISCLIHSPCNASDTEAKKVFDKVEKKLREAKNIQVVFSTKCRTGADLYDFEARGRFMLLPDNKSRLEYIMHPGFLKDADKALQSVKMLLICDGKRLADMRDPGKSIPVKADYAETRVRCLMIGGIVLWGFAVFEPTLQGGDFKCSNFKLGPKENINGKKITVLNFNLSAPTYLGKIVPVSLWINDDTGLPSKVLSRMIPDSPAQYLSDTYAEFILDAIIDQNNFVISKD